MYYATCAKVKERLEDIKIRLSNGFIQPEDNYFTYDSKGLGLTDPVTAGAWEATLALHEGFLYDPLVEGIMNRAVLLKHKRALEATATLPLRRETNKVPGLKDVRNLSSGMIFGGLSEKYRVTVRREEFEKLKLRIKPLQRSDHFASGHPISMHKLIRTSSGSISVTHHHNTQSKADITTTEKASRIDHHHNAAQGEQLHDPNHDSPVQHYEPMDQPLGYTSSYTLNERAEKLNRPDHPEKPCICNAKCIRVSLCASDPAQNRFCEDNGLLCRVTEGMDIDELSYPTKVADEEEEAERASGEYMAQSTAIDRDRQHAFELSPGVEAYSTLELAETYTKPENEALPDCPAYTSNETPPIDHGDLAAALRRLLFGGSLSIWATESSDGERYRDWSCHWHDDMRATIEAHLLSSPADPDFYYPHGIGQGRLNLQRISEQCPSAGQRLLRFTRESIRFKKASPQSTRVSEPSSSRKDGFDAAIHQGPQTKPMSKISLFASRLIGRSSQASTPANGAKPTNLMQPCHNAVNASKTLPETPQ